MACDVVVKNLGLSNCNEFPGLIVGMIETPDSFEVVAADLADPNDVKDALQTALLQATNRAYYWPNFDNVEVISEEAVYQDTPLAYRRVRDGQYRFRFGISQNMCLHRAMYTHRRRNGRAILIDQDGNLIWTKKSNGNYAGFKIGLLNTEKLKFNDGSVTAETPIVVALASNIELDKNGYMYDASSFINELYRIVDVELTIVGTPVASFIVVDVAAVCDGTAISGLVVADFSLIDDDNGASHAISSATESTTVPGRYTLAGISFEDSKLNLVSAASLSIKAYESTGEVNVTIP